MYKISIKCTKGVEYKKVSKVPGESSITRWRLIVRELGEVCKKCISCNIEAYCYFVNTTTPTFYKKKYPWDARANFLSLIIS